MNRFVATGLINDDFEHECDDHPPLHPHRGGAAPERRHARKVSGRRSLSRPEFATVTG